MPHYEVRFGSGQGLEVSANRLTQTGLLEAENVDLERPGVLRKRPGARLFSRSTSSTDPNALIPVGQLRAIWPRRNELLLETDRELLSLQRCAAGAPGSVTVGTATPQEIADGLAVLDLRADRTPTLTVSVPGEVGATSARNRAARPEIPDPLVITPGGRTITVTITAPTPTTLAYAVTENATTEGPVLFPGGTPQRSAAIQDMELYAVGGGVLISYLSAGVLRTIRLTPAAGDAQMTSVESELDAVRGPAASATHEARENAVAAFLADGTLRLYEAASLASVKDFAVASPPPAGAGYQMDIKPVLYPSLPVGVAWISDADDVLHVAQVDPAGPTVTEEADAPNQRSPTARQVGMEQSLSGNLYAVALDDGGAVPVFALVAGDASARYVELNGDDLSLSVTVGSESSPSEYRLFTSAGVRLTADAELQGAPVLDGAFVIRGDEIFGASVAGGVLVEHRLRRQSGVVTAPIPAASPQQAAVAGSGDRLLVGYLSGPSTLTVWSITGVDAAAPDVHSWDMGEVLDESAPLALAVLTEVGGTDYTARAHGFSAEGQYFSATITSPSAGSAATASQVEPWGTVPQYTSSLSAGVPPRVMFGASGPGVRELYEDDQASPLLARVFPPLVVPAGGQWTARGPWRRTRLRSSIVRAYRSGSNSVVSSDAAAVRNSEGDLCIINAVQTSNIAPAPLPGAAADIISTHTEARIEIDASGKRPRVAAYGDQSAFVVYQDNANQLQQAEWSPGAPLSFSPFGATPVNPNVFDVASGNTVGGPVACVAWAVGASTLQLRVFPRGGTAFQYARLTGLITLGSVGVQVEEISGAVYVAWIAVGGTLASPTFTVGLDVIDPVAGTDVAVFSATTGGLAATRAGVVSPLDATSVAAWVEVEDGENRRILQYDVDAGGAVLRRTVLRSAIASQLISLAGGVVGVESMLSVENKAARNGLIMREHVSGEFVGRVALGDTEDADERVQRYTHSSLTRDPNGRLVFGWQETTFGTDTDRAPRSSVYTWDTDVGAHAPAVLDGVAVAAHGGYPRATDGQSVFEYDWHHLPEIQSATAGGGGSLSAGQYRVAVTWAHVDALGFLYRSRPTFKDSITVGAGDSINVAYRGLTHTERDAPRAEIWRSVANGAELYLEAENLALLGTNDAQLQSLTISDDDLLERVELDQGAVVVESDPTPATDFTALANGRIWTRDPRDGGTLRYSTTSRAFDAPRSQAHWNLAQVVAHTGVADVRAVAEMDGRVLILSPLDVSAVYGDGPSNAGEGSYNVPARVPADIGTDNHASLVVLPEGLVYSGGPGVPPQLLTRAYTSAQLGARVADAFHADRQLVASAAYVQATDTLHLADGSPAGGDARTLRYHVGTQRWSRDTGRQALDVATLDNGELFLLTTDGRVLLERLDRYDSGGSGYQIRVRTPWLSQGAMTQPLSVIRVQVIGRHEGGHELRFRARYDYEEQVRGEALVAASIVDADAQSAKLYAYEFRPQLGGTEARAVSIEIVDGGEPNATVILEVIAIDLGASEPAAGGDVTPAQEVPL